ncbi:hypothetical protein VDG1235_2473 [Verrucomicrobiia bacterium DG1235]|nr:hypothetical protein VDG1235_2473 [Verrucomicrobiae bacterium DG1235]
MKKLLLFFVLLCSLASLSRAETLSIVMVHGATAGGWEWKTTARFLQDDGHDVHRVTLTGLGERRHLATAEVNLDTHIDDVVNTILFEDLHNIVLTGHSYGGMVITGVMNRIPDRIRHVVYLDAAVPQDNQSMFDLVGGTPPGSKVVNGLVQFPWFNPDAKPPTGVAHPVGTFRQRVTFDNPDAFKLPVTYVAFVPSDQDPAKRAETDNGWQRAKARGWTIRTFPGSHVAMMEDPRGVASLIEDAAKDQNSTPTADAFAAASPSPQAPSAERQPTQLEIVSELTPPAGAGPKTEQDYSGYIMVYFKDETHCAYLAVSTDGYTFTDLNSGDPIFDGTLLAEQKGVRDPHLARGPDGAFYLVMTDLHIFGDRLGHRETRWQRPEEEHGWGNNRAIVMMKSFDLIHWTHSDYRVDLAFPELGDIDCSWAPQTVYDPAADKMLVYFTIRYENARANIFAAYANDDFTALESTPTMIPNIGGIDSDITQVDGRWHQFYVANATIRHAVSDHITDGYQTTPGRIDPNTVSTEAPNVFKRLGTDTYVLMYDVYGGSPNNMGFSETTDFQSYTDLGRFNEGVMRGTNFNRPKHGAVTYATRDELIHAAKHWNVELDFN